MEGVRGVASGVGGRGEAGARGRWVGGGAAFNRQKKPGRRFFRFSFFPPSMMPRSLSLPPLLPAPAVAPQVVAKKPVKKVS